MLTLLHSSRSYAKIPWEISNPIDNLLVCNNALLLYVLNVNCKKQERTPFSFRFAIPM